MLIKDKDGNAIIAGHLTKDVSIDEIQKKDGSGSWKKASLSVAWKRDEFPMKVDVMFERADKCYGYQKGDYVIAAGTISSREYQGKTYTSMTADYVSKEHAPELVMEEKHVAKDDKEFPF